jgi:hypothetical protein
MRHAIHSAFHARMCSVSMSSVRAQRVRALLVKEDSAHPQAHGHEEERDEPTRTAAATRLDWRGAGRGRVGGGLLPRSRRALRRRGA